MCNTAYVTNEFVNIVYTYVCLGNSSYFDSAYWKTELESDTEPNQTLAIRVIRELTYWGLRIKSIY